MATSTFSSPVTVARAVTARTQSSIASANSNTDYSQSSAYGVMDALLQSVGLESLSSTLKSLMQQGITDTNQLNLQLQQTDAWKQRFAGNEQLKAQGLPELSVNDYLSAESSYAQIMKQYGLPSGFYDSRADFANFIGNRVSPSELQQRVQDYADFNLKTTDPAVSQQLQAMGLDSGHVLANLMDPSRALPLIQNQVNTVLLGAAARRAGTTADTSFLSQLAARGVTEADAQTKFGESAQMQPGLNEIASIYGNQQFSNQQAQNVAFNSNAQDAQTANRLLSQQRGAFGGYSGSGAFSNSSADGGNF